MTLTPRLALCAALCAGARRVIDVGCDHAYLSVALARAGAQVCATDVRRGPLEAARRSVAESGLEGRIGLHLGDGLSDFSPDDCDTVAICGMGGETIAAILAAAPWTADGAHALVLQPQTRAEELRRFLAEQGYTVEREALARESEKLYVALRARGGKPPMGAENAYYCTGLLYGDPLFSDYLAAQMARLDEARRGKERAGLDAAAERAALSRLEELSHGA